jgi:hypothetical protein
MWGSRVEQEHHGSTGGFWMCEHQAAILTSSTSRGSNSACPCISARKQWDESSARVLVGRRGCSGAACYLATSISIGVRRNPGRARLHPWRKSLNRRRIWISSFLLRTPNHFFRLSSLFLRVKPWVVRRGAAVGRASCDENRLGGLMSHWPVTIVLGGETHAQYQILSAFTWRLWDNAAG